MAEIRRAFLGDVGILRAVLARQEAEKLDEADRVGRETDDLLAGVQVRARTLQIRTGKNTGRCKCLKVISKNKESCRACSGDA